MLEQLKSQDPTILFRPHEKQQLVCNSPSKYIWVFGGNRSGKTEICTYETKRMLEGTHPVRSLSRRWDGNPWLIWLCSQDGETQRDVLQKKWDKTIPKSWIISQPQRAGEYVRTELMIPNVQYGMVKAEVAWKTYDSKDETFEGASVDLVLGDEEPPKTKYEGIMARLFDSGAWGNGFFMCGMTPVKGEGWTITEILDPYKDGKLPHIFVVEMSTYDNAVNLGGVERVKEFELSIPEEARPARIYGIGFAREGYVLNTFKDELYPNGHVLMPFKPDWSAFCPFESIDYGFSVPTSIGFYAVDSKNTIYKYDEIYVRGHTVPELKSLIYKKRREYGYDKPIITLIDPSSARTESNGKRIIDQFSSKEQNVWVGAGKEPTNAHMLNLYKKWQAGKISWKAYQDTKAEFEKKEGYASYPVGCAPADNRREQGWDLFNEYLTFDKNTNLPRFFITKNCVESRREMMRLKWKKTKDGSPSKNNEVSGDDHACDEGRYMCSFKPMYNKSWFRRLARSITSTRNGSSSIRVRSI